VVDEDPAKNAQRPESEEELASEEDLEEVSWETGKEAEFEEEIDSLWSPHHDTNAEMEVEKRHELEELQIDAKNIANQGRVLSGDHTVVFCNVRCRYFWYFVMWEQQIYNRYTRYVFLHKKNKYYRCRKI